MEPKDMGNKIKNARMAKGMTQKELASQVHVTDKAVSKWERGLCFPDMSNLEPLADALGMKMTELFIDSSVNESEEEKAETSLKEAVQLVKARQKKQRRDIILAFAGMFLFELLAFMAICFFLVTDLFVEKDKAERIEDYETYMAVPDARHNPFAPPGKVEWIFPRSIPEGAHVNDFYYEYYNPWDPNYVIYLDITYDEDAYEKERDRISTKCGMPLDQTRYLVYGAEGFYYPVLSASGDSSGILYALTDEKARRIMYVEIAFCNYFSDIDYEPIIPPEILPAGFDAGKNNPTRRKFVVEQEGLRIYSAALPDFSYFTSSLITSGAISCSGRNSSESIYL